MKSLRTRLIVGSLLSGAGLLAMAIAIALTVVHRHPEWIGIAHNVLLTMVAIACVVAGLSQLRRGLSPFDQLRTRLLEVRDGRARRLDGAYPSEVQPLVTDLNALLDDRERSIARAVAKAGDLAHGLKTPLALLAQEAARAEAAGQRDLADAIRQQVERMRRQMEYHLAQARAAASGAAPGARASVKESVDGLVRTVLRLYADRGLAIEVRVPAAQFVQGQRDDLDEMLGNLIDNACKWARSRVVVSSRPRGAALVISVEDDGAGIEPAMRYAVLQRGVRADEAAPGWGVGLAIVRDLAEVYGGSIALGESTEGGLRADLTLPGAEA